MKRVRYWIAENAPILVQRLRDAGVLSRPETARDARYLRCKHSGDSYKELTVCTYSVSDQYLEPLHLGDERSLDYAKRLWESANWYRNPHDFGVFEVPDVKVLMNNGVHYSKHGNFVQVYCNPAVFRNPKYDFPRRTLPYLPVRKWHETGIFITPSWAHNYYHWLIEMLPRLALVRNSVAEKIPVVVSSSARKFVHESVAHILGESSVLRLTGNLHGFRSLVMPTNLSMPLDVNPTSIAFLRHAFGINENRGVASSPQTSRQIYVSRRDSPYKHRLVNEEHVEVALRSLGFESVVMTELSVKQQADLFASASVIVGHHGAGFSNLAFSASGSIVIEIFHDGHYSPSFNRIAQIRNLRYGFMVGDAVGPHTFADVNRLVTLIGLMESYA